MKKRKIIIFVLAAVMVLSLALPAFAAYSKKITVYPGVKIYVDDAKLNPTDVNGNTVEVFIYNGTTYLPVRAVSEALGEVVQWDGVTNSVYIGKHTGDKPAAWLTDLDYFTKSIIDEINCTTKDNLGTEHKHSITFGYRYGGSNDYSIVYQLNKQYSQLTGQFYQQYYYRADDHSTAMEIYGDGELLWKGDAGGGMEPAIIDADITGVQKLEIKLYGDAYDTALGDLGLWT